MEKIKTHIIYSGSTIRNALEALNKISTSPNLFTMNLFVVDENKCMIGTLTDGDIRRGLLDNKTLDDIVNNVMNTDFYALEEGEFSQEKIRHFRENHIKLIPILDKQRVITDVLDLNEKLALLPLDAVLMAGGQGKRLRPLTKNTPKPLLKVGNKPIIEYIIDRIDKFGIPNLSISVNYLADKFISHFDECKNKWDLNINFHKENKPLGTMGALSLMGDFKHKTILLSNADLLSTIDYEKFYQFFLDSGADISVASIPYNVKVPFGVFETNGTEVLSIQEKPEYSYFSNAGIYLMKRSILRHLPKNKFMDITDFLKERIQNHTRVTYYPMLGYWQDIGRHEDFKKVQKDIHLINI